MTKEEEVIEKFVIYYKHIIAKRKRKLTTLGIITLICSMLSCVGMAHLLITDGHMTDVNIFLMILYSLYVVVNLVSFTRAKEDYIMYVELENELDGSIDQLRNMV